MLLLATALGIGFITYAAHTWVYERKYAKERQLTRQRLNRAMRDSKNN